VSTACVVILFFCHLSALGIYGVGLLSFELMRLCKSGADLSPLRIVDFVASGLPFLAAAPLLLPESDDGPHRQHLVGSARQDRRTDVRVLRFIRIIAAWALIGRHGREHDLAVASPRPALSSTGVDAASSSAPLVYLALPRIMFDTYMTDQRVPLGVVFMLLPAAT